MKIKFIFATTLFSFLGSACDPVKGTLNYFGLVQKKDLPVEVRKEMNAVSEVAPEKKASELAKANSELLFEMTTVVFNLKEVDDKSNFGALANSLNDGASLEGIYRGLIMGSRYRGLEAKSQAASPELLKLFAHEMAELQLEMKNPTEFLKEEAIKPPSIEYPDGNSINFVSNAPKAAPHSQEVKPKPNKNALADELLDNFIGASPFTLKRVLADEAMKKMDEMKDSQGEFAQWYAKLVVRLCEAHIDFGLAQRDDPNFDFHFKFAQTMSLDRVKWEVLNRFHRLLNSKVN